MARLRRGARSAPRARAGARPPADALRHRERPRRPEAAARLRAAHEAGHEIANHSLDHRYDLVRLRRSVIEWQVEEAAHAIEDAVGERPVGFRAPGYTITDEVSWTCSRSSASSTTRRCSRARRTGRRRRWRWEPSRCAVAGVAPSSTLPPFCSRRRGPTGWASRTGSAAPGSSSSRCR